MTKHWLKISLMLAIGALITTTAQAAIFDTSDVFASIGNGLVKVYDPTLGGTLIATLDTTKGLGTFTTGSVANTTTGNFYVTDFNANAVTVFNSSGVRTGDFGTGFGADPESILFDGAGNVFVGQADGTHNVLEFNSGGTLLNTFAPLIESRGTDWIELAGDQHTLYYTSEGTHVKRFDTLTSTQLSDLNAVPLAGSAAFALRILSDGTVLVADTDAVRRLNAAGAVIQTYSPAGGVGELFALNLDPDGTSFWTGNDATGILYKVDIATGTVLNTIDTGCGSTCLFGVSVFGEITAANTPEASQLGTSLALIGLLALLGYRRSKAKKAAENV
jgi:DNA-binding beta-propeller fold protein YncE